MNRTIFISQAVVVIFLFSMIVGICNLSPIANSTNTGSGSTDLLIGVCITAAAGGLILACSLLQEERRKLSLVRKPRTKLAIVQAPGHWGLPPAGF